MPTAQKNANVVNFNEHTTFRARPKEMPELGLLMRSPYHLCAFLRDRIAKSKIQYKELAKQTGLCVETVSRMATGEPKAPRLNTAFVLLTALGVKIYLA
mgnify:FL=1